MIFISLQLNGWIRLWLLVSFVWMVVVGALQYSEFKLVYDEKSQHLAQHRKEFIDLLPAEQKAFLKPGFIAVADPKCVLVPNGKLNEELLRGDMTLAQREALWDAYVEIADRFYRKERAQGIIIGGLVLAIGVPLITLFFGFAIAWIVRGFRHNPAAP